MPLAKILNYHKWRKHVESKDFSDVLNQNKQSYYDQALKSGGWIGGNTTIDQLIGEKGGALSMFKRQDEKAFRQLVNDLKKSCEKESIFRKEKVDKLKALIKNKQYYVPGQLVAQKWFPE